jgi:hypothetical protein
MVVGEVMNPPDREPSRASAGWRVVDPESGRTWSGCPGSISVLPELRQVAMVDFRF